MNSIYIDTLFFVNFITDYIILLCTAKMNGVVIRRKQIAIAAAIGSVFACLCTYAPNAWYSHQIMKITVAFILCEISFGSSKYIIRCFISFLIISALFGGILSMFVISSSNEKKIEINSKAILLTFTVTYFILTMLYKKTGKQYIQSYVEAEISICNRTIFLTLMEDSGNELVDPITLKPVIFIEKEYLYNIIPELMTQKQDIYAQYCFLSEIDALKGKIRLIPFQTISEKGTTLGIIPDYVMINGKTKEVIIAPTEIKFSQTNQYQGIF